MKRAFLGICLTACTMAWGATAPRSEAAAATPSIPFEKYQLANGLEVILHTDRRLPVTAVSVWYHVGALNELPGRTGFAHLFEHMMFQGSKHVPDDAHLSMLERIGASDLNGTTSFDRTNYFETVPSNRLELALWLESDRMGFLLEALTEAKLNNQREVVKNERRQSVETAPYGLAEEKAWKALFPAPHPYFGQVIGSMEDLEAATLAEVGDFFRTWYAPSNATLAIVGNFDPQGAKALVEKYFGPLSSRPKPVPRSFKPLQLGHEVVIDHAETVASLPKISISWLTPAILEKGDAEADILASILGQGRASRLQRKLLFDKPLAQSVAASQQSLSQQSVFEVDAVVRPGVDPAVVQRELEVALEDVRKNGVTEEEVRRARDRFETATFAGLQSVGGFGGKAEQLQSYNHYAGDPGYLARDLARYAAVTPATVQAFARDYLDPKQRVLLRAVPSGSAGPVSSAGPPGSPSSGDGKER